MATSTSVIFVEKTFSSIFDLSLLTKKSTRRNSRLQPWVGDEKATTLVTPDLLADECVTSTEESTEDVPKRILG